LRTVAIGIGMPALAGGKTFKISGFDSDRRKLVKPLYFVFYPAVRLKWIARSRGFGGGIGEANCPYK